MPIPLKETSVVGNLNNDKQINLTQDQKKLFNILGNEALSARELMQKMGFAHKASFYQKYIKPALKLGLIEMTIPNMPSNRNQKYKRK